MNEFEQSTRQTLRHSERLLDDETVSALAERRKQALETPAKKRLPSFFAPAVGMAAASLVALVLIYPFATTDEFPEDDFLTGNPDLYEDLEFYSWLAANENPIEG